MILAILVNHCYQVSVLCMTRKSKSTKLCPLVGSGILFMDHPKGQPLCLVGWTPRVWVITPKNEGNLGETMVETYLTHTLLHRWRFRFSLGFQDVTPRKTNILNLIMGAPWKFGDSELGHHHCCLGGLCYMARRSGDRRISQTAPLSLVGFYM